MIPKIKNIYVVAAHLDDVEIGLYTYLKRETLREDTVINISIYISSTGLDNKPMDLNLERKKVFFQNLESIRETCTGSVLASVSGEARDLELPEQFGRVRIDIERFIKDTYMVNEDDTAENILIYNNKDIHRDHSTINDICNVIARPISQGGIFDWNEVLNFNIPSNDYNQYGLIYGNSQNSGGIFLELTKEEIKTKKDIINNYFHAGILRNPVKKKDLSTEKLNLVYKRY